MTSKPRMRLSGIVLGSPNARELAAFYQRLLDWEEKWNEPDWVMLRPQDEGAGLSFQTESDYKRPVWPEQPGEQQMMIHLDIRVDDLEEAAAHARALGATLADFQPQHDVRVYFDPAGHPFCLFVE